MDRKDIVTMTDDELITITNSTEYRKTEYFKYGNNYDSILEIYTDAQTGEIFSVICVSDSNLMEMMIDLPDVNELQQLSEVYYYEEDNPQPTETSYPPFQVTFTKDNVTILLSTKDDVTKYYQKDRVCYYLDDNDTLLYIRINDLKPEEYERLKKQKKNTNKGNDETKKTLENIETQENIEIIQACIIGSHAWGDYDNDSDNDIRFIYMRDLKDYLSLHKKADNLHYPISEKLDLEGWDLIKFLSLLGKQNSGAYEFLFSPKQIIENEYINKLREYSQSILVPSKMAMQYVNIVERRMKEMNNKESMKLKLYLYFLRLICVAKYVLATGQFPICNFETILSIPENEQLKPLIEKLIVHKKDGIKEIKIADFMQPLLISECNLIKSKIKEDEPIIEDDEKIDELFIEGVNFFGKTLNYPSENVNKVL